MNNNFEVYFTDARFPGISVLNSGTIEFKVVKDDKCIDSFSRFEMGLDMEVSLLYAKDMANNFFDYLEFHPWLFKVYMYGGLK